MKQKLNVLLAKTDHLGSSYKKAVEDYFSYFSKKQGDFKGIKNTYEARPGTIDLPNQRGTTLIVTTVDEKLKWLEENNKEFIDALFSQEATNASGVATAELKVDGKSFGKYSSLELLRLKSLLENNNLEQMYANIPVRPDSEIWDKSSNEMYSGRPGVYESKVITGVQKTLMKENYILTDPNLDKVKQGNYSPQIAVKDTVIELGDSTHQRFSGEWSHRERAELLRRRTKLLSAVVEALKISNEVECVDSGLTSEKIFGYLHRGQI